MAVTINDRQLNEFLELEWDRGMSFLQMCFSSLSEDEQEDIVQDSMIIFANNIRNGKYEQQDATPHTYLMAICKNQALKRTEWHKNKKMIPINEGQKPKYGDGFDLSDDLNYIKQGSTQYIPEHIDFLVDLYNDTELERERKIEAVKTTIKQLTDKCQVLIWGKYRDKMSMKVLAEMTGLKNANVAKTSLSRCIDNFEKEFKKLIKI